MKLDSLNILFGLIGILHFNILASFFLFLFYNLQEEKAEITGVGCHAIYLKENTTLELRQIRPKQFKHQSVVML